MAPNRSGVVIALRSAALAGARALSRPQARQVLPTFFWPRRASPSCEPVFDPPAFPLAGQLYRSWSVSAKFFLNASMIVAYPDLGCCGAGAAMGKAQFRQAVWIFREVGIDGRHSCVCSAAELDHPFQVDPPPADNSPVHPPDRVPVSTIFSPSSLHLEVSAQVARPCPRGLAGGFAGHPVPLR